MFHKGLTQVSKSGVCIFIASAHIESRTIDYSLSIFENYDPAGVKKTLTVDDHSGYQQN